MRRILFLFFACVAMTMQAQLRNDDVWKTDLGKNSVREVIRIPDVGRYKTLKCDFHVHTIFSDGNVWPSSRVDEAWLAGYDAIAITDHIEYRPHKEQLNGDHNESFNIAKKRANEIGFILIKGAEITRSKPLGHLNALFLLDANALDIEDPLKAIDEVKSQGALILWNHPGWPDNKSTLYEVHEKLLADKKIDMLEVHNHTEYYPLTFDWIEKFDIAPSANSDTHELISTEYGTGKLARPITLVFASERSEAAIKEAIKAKRTAALFDNILMAKKEWAEKLLWASIHYRIISINGNSATVEIENISDIPFSIKTSNGDRFELPANKVVRKKFTFPDTITVTNIFVGHNKNLEFPLPEG
jgi:predicted metal-dependent phosphoesterase TrpH